MSTARDIETIRAFLRAHDPDRYLTALFAPKRHRAPLMALYAFYAELARIPDLVSEPALGEIRLQWWRDSLERMRDEGESGAPVADALGAVIREHDLPGPALQGMIDARSADLDGGGFADLPALKAYLYKTEGAVFALGADILGGTGKKIGSAANAAGVAYGLARLLQNLPRDAAAGRVMLPLYLLQEHGLEPEQILAGQQDGNVRQVLDSLTSEARGALVAARDGVTELDPEIRSAFAPLAMVEPYLAAIERTRHNPLHDISDINPLLRFVKLWRAVRSGGV